MTLGLEREVIDPKIYDRNVQHLREAGVSLPRFSDLADPVDRLSDRFSDLPDVDVDSPDVGNLFRVHWHNDATRRGISAVPEHIVLGPEITGVDARIIVALGNRFPMIRAHKVLAAYGCLVPRLLSGKFDATRHRAVCWHGIESAHGPRHLTCRISPLDKRAPQQDMQLWQHPRLKPPVFGHLVDQPV